MTKEEVKKYTEVLDVAREAINDAICCEDGLDGGTGEVVIKWITDILGDYDEWIKTHTDPEPTEELSKGSPFPRKTAIELIREKHFDIEAKARGYVKPEESGYRLPAGKAPLLTEEEIDDIIHSYFDPADFGILYPDRRPFEAVTEAQRDADHKWYGGKE